MNREELKKEYRLTIPEWERNYCWVAYGAWLEDKIISQQETIDLQFKDIEANLEETEGLHGKIKELEAEQIKITAKLLMLRPIEGENLSEELRQLAVQIKDRRLIK